MATARFVRAFVYFNLVNYFGDVPLVTSIDYNKTATQGREKTNLLYDHIIRDLTIAQAFLPEKYQHQQRVMPTKWAAKALLARAYLYTKQFAKAIAEADTVISQPALYELSGNLSNVFSVSSREAIWQLEANSKTVSGNVTLEGLRFLPFPAVTQSQPSYYLTQSLTQQFETGDKRLAEWTVVNSYQAGHYRLPYKYKEGRAQQAAGAAPKEFNTVLRLAELYLIRAEACAQAGQVSQARADVNKIRSRAGLQELTADTRERLMQALQQEKQKEFFAEWGHRWMDLKRWDLANEILAPQKGSNWQPTDQLYPLPVTELSFAPNLTQNPGY